MRQNRTQRVKRKLVSLEVALVHLHTPSEVVEILTCLWSRHELTSMHNRWAAFQLLLGGKTQREVRDHLGISIATVSRAAAVMADKPKIIERILERSARKLARGG